MNEKKLSIKVNNKLFSDTLYKLALVLTKISPRNMIDPMTQESIPENNAVYTSDRYQFDIVSLKEWIKNKKAFINPFTNKNFDIRDIDALIKNNPDIKVREEKRGPQAPSSLDLDAIAAAQAEPVRPGYVELFAAIAAAQAEPMRPGYAELFAAIAAARAEPLRPEPFGPRHRGYVEFFGREAAVPVQQHLNNIYRYLNEAKILNNENRNLLNQCIGNIRTISFGVQNLARYRILNQDNFIFLMIDPAKANVIASILGALNNVGILNPGNRQLLQDNNLFVEEICYEIFALTDAGMPFDQQVFERIIQDLPNNYMQRLD